MRSTSLDAPARARALPARRRRLLGILAAAAIAAVLGISTARAGATDVPPPDALADAALSDRLGLLAARAADAEKTLGAELAELDQSREAVDEKVRQVAALRIPEGIAGATTTALTPQAARARHDAAAARLDGLRERRRLIGEQRAVLLDRGKQLERTRAAASALIASFGELTPLEVEAERRVAAGKIPREKLPSAPSAAALGERRARVADAQKARDDEALQVASNVQTLDRILRDGDEALAAAEGAVQAAAQDDRDAARRESIEKELAGKDPGSLPALLVGLDGESQRLRAMIGQQRASMAEASAAAAAAEKDLSALSAPDPEAVALVETLPRVRPAEKTLRVSEALAAWHAARTQRLGRVLTATAVLLDRAVAVTKALGPYADDLVRLEVMVGLIDRQRAGGAVIDVTRTATPAGVRAERDAVAAETAAVAREAQRCEQRLASVTRETDEARAAERAEREQQKALQEAYEGAKEAARFTSEVERLPAAGVLQSFQDALLRWQKAEGARAVVKERLAVADTGARIAEERVASIEDPIYRRVRQQRASERRKVLEALFARAGREAPPIDPADARAQAPGASGPAATSGPDQAMPRGPSWTAWISSRVEARQETIAGTIRFVDDQSRGFAGLRIASLTQLAVIEAASSAAVETLSRAQRAHGAALELETRVGQGEITASALPAGVSDALRRDPLTSLEVDVAMMAKALVAARERLSRLDARIAESLERLASLKSAQAIGGRKLDALRQLSRLESEYDRDPAALPEAERKKREQEITRLIDEEDTTWENALQLFGSERDVELHELLRAYYGQVVDLERKRRNIEDRRALVRALIRLSAEDRKLSEKLVEPARAELAQRRADLAEAEIAGGLVAPGDPAALLALQGAGRAPPLPGKPESLTASADVIFEARLRAGAAEARAADDENRLSQSGVLSWIGNYEDYLGAIGARADDIERDLARLRGLSSEAVARLDAEEPPRADADRAHLLQGDILWTRGLRRDALRRSAVKSLVTLLGIIVAVLVLLIVPRFFAHCFLARVRAQKGDGALEREQRAKTVIAVARRFWGIVVVLAAGVYVLRLFRFDVTPIVASAGVVGLGLSFGAQTLVRDYLAGFFMILENQYKIGDYVTIGSLQGTVEEITMRLTVLRDANGTVHFIPNGSIASVSNQTKGWSGATIDIGVSYKEDADRVVKVLEDVGRAMLADPALGPRMLGAPIVQGIEKFGDSVLTIRMSLRTRQGEQGALARELRRRVKRTFNEMGIEIH